MALGVLILGCIKSGFKFVFFPQAFLLTAYSLYIGIPACFLNEINVDRNWNFGPQTITKTIFATNYCYTVVLINCLTVYCHAKKSTFPLCWNNNFKNKRLFEITLFFWGLAVVLLVPWERILTESLFLPKNKISSTPENYRYIKLCAYLAILYIPYIICVLKHFLMALLFVVCFFLTDLFYGFRTTAFIGIISFLVPLSLSQKNNFKCNILSFCLVILLFTSGYWNRQWIIDSGELKNAFGEFTEVFLTTPFLIDQNISLQFSNKSVFYILSPIFRKFYNVDNQQLVGHPGSIIASEIGLGYGFGCNMISEAYYFFGWLGIFICPFLCALFSNLVYQNLKNSSLSVPLLILFCVICRLIVREGFFFYFVMFIYLYVIIILFPKILFKVKFE